VEEKRKETESNKQMENKKKKGRKWRTYARSYCEISVTELLAGALC
jgi:hypothetical protein